ncbi:MAG: hypothetical protein C4525_13060 [Desulfarculus sp.]|nr:MAG: hypothetical protein C4525_13060 [Desulfarculus sp.]
MTGRQIWAVALAVFVIGLAGMLLGRGLVQAGPAQEMVQAREFRLVNDQGVLRASLKVSDTGNLLVTMYDGQGQTSEELVVTPQLVQSARKTSAAIKRLESLWKGVLPQKKEK